MTASDARPPSDENREALAAALREIGPVIAEKLLDHQWFRETVERTGREAMSQHPEPARPPSDTGTTGWHIHDDRQPAFRTPCRCLAVNPHLRPVLVVDPAEARDTIARVHREHRRNEVDDPGMGHEPVRWRAKCDGDSCDFYVTAETWWEVCIAHEAHLTAAVLAALAGQGQP